MLSTNQPFRGKCFAFPTLDSRLLPICSMEAIASKLIGLKGTPRHKMVSLPLQPIVVRQVVLCIYERSVRAVGDRLRLPLS